MNTTRSARLSPLLLSILSSLWLLALPAPASPAPAPQPAAGSHGAGTPAPAEGAGGAVVAPVPPGAGATCVITPLKVEKAYNAATSSPNLQLADILTLTVEMPGLSQLREQLAKPACKDKKLVLYLDGRPIPGLEDEAKLADPNSRGILRFNLWPTDASRAAWSRLLGSPKWNARPIAVSLGLADGSAFPTDPPILINLAGIPHDRFFWWALLVGAMLVGFLVLAVKSDLLRDAGPSPGGGARRPFSLSRTQAAWWFFIVLGAYLLIGLVTGDYLSSITSQVLVLLGISAGTVVGAAVIDASQQKPESQVRRADALARLTVQVAQADAGLQTIQTAHQEQSDLAAKAAEVAEGAKSILTQDSKNPQAAQSVQATQATHAVQAAKAAQTGAVVAAANANLSEKLSQLRAARNETENFFVDILSDADGVSFHRFQNAAWTVVLGIIFVCQVYRDLVMPQFNGSLLALLGISAGTYLGMKIPEPKVPTVTP